MHKYTPEEDEWIRQNYMLYSETPLTKAFNAQFGTDVSVQSIKARRKKRLKLKKKGPECEVGSIYMHCGRPLIKATNTGDRHKDWVTLGRYIYEQEYGKLPDMYQVIHLDGDPTNCELDNLLAVTRKAALYLAKYEWYGLGEITRTGNMIFELEELIKEDK